MKFLDLVRALEAFFKDKPGAIIWIDLFSTSQHATFDRGREWWQQTFMFAIGRMGRMVMVMTPWDNPICLTRSWCLIELYACRSSRSTFAVAFPPSERVRFLEQISERGDAFYDMLRKVNTAKSGCSRESDRDRIFDAVRTIDRCNRVLGDHDTFSLSLIYDLADLYEKKGEDGLALSVPQEAQTFSWP